MKSMRSIISGGAGCWLFCIFASCAIDVVELPNATINGEGSG
jgi:hypothetical protein